MMRKYQKMALGIGMLVTMWALPAAATDKTQRYCGDIGFYPLSEPREINFQHGIKTLCDALNHQITYKLVPAEIDNLIFKPASEWLNPDAPNRQQADAELTKIFGKAPDAQTDIDLDLTRLEKNKLDKLTQLPNPLLKFLATNVKNQEKFKPQIRAAYYTSGALTQLKQAFRVSLPGDELSQEPTASPSTKKVQTENTTRQHRSLFPEIDLIDWILLGLNGFALLMLALMALWMRNKLEEEDLYSLQQGQQSSSQLLPRLNQKIEDLQQKVESQALQIKELKRGMAVTPPSASPPTGNWPPNPSPTQSPFNLEKPAPPPDPKKPQVILQKFLDNPQVAIAEYSPLALVVPMDNQNARRNNPAMDVQLEQRSSHHQANYLAFETYNGQHVVMPRLDFNFQSALIQQLGLDYLYDLQNRPAGNAGTVSTIQRPAIMRQDGGRWHLVSKGSCAF